MKLREAIEIKTIWLKGDEAVANDELIEADRLLIEAGKDYARLRPHVLPPRCQLLPGETKE